MVAYRMTFLGVIHTRGGRHPRKERLAECRHAACNQGSASEISLEAVLALEEPDIGYVPPRMLLQVTDEAIEQNQ